MKDKQSHVQSTIQGIWVHSRFGMKLVILAFVLFASLLGQIDGHGMFYVFMCRSKRHLRTFLPLIGGMFYPMPWWNKAGDGLILNQYPDSGFELRL